MKNISQSEKSTTLDERGITVQTVVIVAVLALVASLASIVIYNAIANRSSDIVSAANVPDLEGFSDGAGGVIQNPQAQTKKALDDYKDQIASGGYHTCVITGTDKSVKCWGANAIAQLGYQTPSTPQPTPQTISGLTGAKAVVAGDRHSCIITSTDTIKCWGGNSAGQLGVEEADYIDAVRVTPVGPTTLSDVKELAASNRNTCAIVTEGGSDEVYCFGNNTHGQIGKSNLVVGYAIPQKVDGLTGAKKVTVGEFHTCAINAIDEVHCWGRNDFFQIGAPSSVAMSHTLVKITGVDGATDISAGGSHTCAILADTTVKCWGANDRAQLGANPTERSATPLAVSGLTGVKSLAVGGNRSCAITSSGGISCWGDNSDGQISLTERKTRNRDYLTTSTPIPGFSNIVSASAGIAHMCSIELIGKSTQRVKCYGSNQFSQLGKPFVRNPDPIFAAGLPQKISGITDADSISVGRNMGCIIASDKTVKCWGSNGFQRLGLSATTTYSTTPQNIAGITGVKKIAHSSEAQYYCVIASNEDTSDPADVVKCRGENFDGSLGLPATTTVSPTFITIPGIKNPKKLNSGQYHNCVVVNERAIVVDTVALIYVYAYNKDVAKCWGTDATVQMGQTTTYPNAVLTPVIVQGIQNGYNYDAIIDVENAVAGAFHSCVLHGTTTKAAKCFGYNGWGLLGDSSLGTVVGSYWPKEDVTFGTGVVPKALAAAFLYTCAIVTQSSTDHVECWGRNNFGQLGVSNVITVPGGVDASHIPRRISGLTGATEIATATTHACAIVPKTTGGTTTNIVKCWGGNFEGQLGVPHTTVSLATFSPREVTGLTNVKAIATGRGLSCAIVGETVNGSTVDSVYCWGNFASGALGIDPINEFQTFSEPQTVAGL